MADPAEEFEIDNAQCGLDDAIKAAKAVVSALECAESCETPEDYFANVQEAKDMTAELKKELAELRDKP
jgi:hypothetical protein